MGGPDSAGRQDADGPGRALVAWLEDRFQGTVRLVEPPASSGDGFDSVVHLVHVAGDTLPEEWRGPLVLRVKADVERVSDADREAAIHSWLVERGYPAPRMVHVFRPGELFDLPAQVLERAPGVLMIDRVRARPWRARQTVRQLGSLQVRLHLLATDGFPGDDDLLDRRLRLTRHVVETDGNGALRSGLAHVEELADELRAAPAFACHGDFHPLNVLVSDDGASVIDWTDAALGDRHGDVARTLVLFETAAIAATSAAERRALGAIGPRLGRGYRRAYERELPLDGHRLKLWRPVHLLHGWSQAISLHAGAEDRADRFPPSTVADLRRRFHEALDAVI